MTSTQQKISLVVPAYNEEQNLPMLRHRLMDFFNTVPEYDFELIIVDDHSADATTALVRAWADQDKRVRLVRLSRNCGSHAALYAGLTQCTGDAAVFLAADLQDPPEVVAEMITRWQAGSDVVWATRSAREGESASVKLYSKVYHIVVSKLALPESLSADFFLIDRKVMDAYLKIPEKHTDFMFMVQWMGFRQSTIPYVKRARTGGESKWTFSKKLKLFVDSIVSFSFTPIRVMSLLGVLFASGGFAFAAYVVIGRLAGWVVAGTGYAALMTVLLTGFGLVMLMLGIIGEYLWRTFDEARGRPRFIIEETYPKKPQ